MTWSIGFRAPTWQHLLQDLSDSVAEKLNNSQRYSDSRLKLQDNPAEISADSLKKVRKKLHDLMHLNDTAFANWFGTAVSQQACELPIFTQEEVNADTLKEQFSTGRVLMLSPYVRLSYVRGSNGFQVYINGEHCHINSPLIPFICQQRCIEIDDGVNLSNENTLIDWLCDGYTKGYWVWQDELLEDDE